MVRAIQGANLALVSLAILISFTWLLVRAICWRILLQNKASYWQVFLTVNEGYLLNNLLPFRLGEIGRAFLLSHKTGLAFWQIFPTILIERILDLAMAVGLLLCTLPFVVGAAWAREGALIASSLVVAGLVGLYLLARHRDLALKFFEKLGTRWPWLRKVGGERLPAFLSGLEILTQGGLFLWAVLWIVFDWMIAILEYFILMQAFLPEAEFLWAAFSLGVVSLGIAAPSSPGAVGVLELSLVGALSIFGIDTSKSLAFALSAHLINYLLTGGVGAIALAKDGESLGGIYRRIRQIPQKEM